MGGGQALPEVQFVIQRALDRPAFVHVPLPARVMLTQIAGGGCAPLSGQGGDKVTQAQPRRVAGLLGRKGALGQVHIALQGQVHGLVQRLVAIGAPPGRIQAIAGGHIRLRGHGPGEVGAVVPRAGAASQHKAHRAKAASAGGRKKKIRIFIPWPALRWG